MTPGNDDNEAIQEAYQVNKWTQPAIGSLALAVLLIWGGVWLAKALDSAHEAVHQTTCVANLNQIQMAFLNYHETYGSFPPAYVVDEQGERMHSWRVLILPFIGREDVYEQYHFDEAWNSPHNRKLEHEIYNDMYHCPSGSHAGDSPLTDYVVVTGAATAFPGDKSTSVEDFKDGIENTIVLVEIANSDIHWMEPRDLEFDRMSFDVDDSSRPSVSSPHPCGPAIVFADSIRAYRLDQSICPETLKAMLTVSGGEGVIKDNLYGHSEDSRCRCLREIPR